MDFTEKRDIFTVSRLNGEARIALDVSFPGKIWVEGEISNLSRPASGHIYFSLKDALSQVRCAMFRMNVNRLSFQPSNGDQVLVQAKVSLYEPRGDFQLVADHMEPAGEGLLLRAFEQLKQTLHGQGFFDEEHKQALPNFPSRLGVITSPSGAAIRDILNVTKRRFPGLPVVIYPTAVQGQEASQQIANAITLANQRAECDVLIVGRGGGSLEDLWCFNEEIVARAIFASKIPIVSGVGHDIDFTISDMVADHHAPTPSAAAELVTPDAGELLHHLKMKETRLHQFATHCIKQQQQKLMHLQTRLAQQHPKNQLEQKSQRLDELSQRLLTAQQRRSERRRIYLSELVSRLYRHSPQQKLEQLSAKHNLLEYRLTQAIHNRLRHKQQQLGTTLKTLEAISPLATLARGYSIVMDEKNQKTLHDSASVNIGDTVITQLHKGKLVCTVKDKQEDG